MVLGGMSEKYRLTVVTGYGGFSKEEIDALWDAGVDMDDWDYVIFGPPEILVSREEEQRDWDSPDPLAVVKATVYTPHDYQIERLLQGCSDNTWYLIEWEGKQTAVGVAYHA